MSKQRSNTLGLVVPDITNPFFPSLVQAIEHAARQRGQGILITDSHNDVEAEREALRMLVDRRVDAILISPTHLTDSLDGLVETARVVPLIQIDRVIDETLPYVRADQSEPIRTIVDHLRASGRQHLAFIAQQTAIATSTERETAFIQLMGAAFPDEPIRLVKESMSVESGRPAAREIMTTWPDTDAIICANDLIAVGVLQELGSHPGRRDVAISGFDDTLLARPLRLTSVRQPVDQMADAALTAAMHPGSLGGRLAVTLASEVMLRLSTA